MLKLPYRLFMGLKTLIQWFLRLQKTIHRVIKLNKAIITLLNFGATLYSFFVLVEPHLQKLTDKKGVSQDRINNQ